MDQATLARKSGRKNRSEEVLVGRICVRFNLTRVGKNELRTGIKLWEGEKKGSGVKPGKLLADKDDVQNPEGFLFG